MSNDPSELKKFVESHPGIHVIRGGGASNRAWNGIRYKTGLSGKNVGSQGLSMNLASVPPGAIASAHIHNGFEVMLFIIEGKVRHEFGPDLEHAVENEAGDFIYIEPGVPHEVFNIGDGPATVVVARSAADEWDKIIDFPSKYRERDGVPPKNGASG